MPADSSSQASQRFVQFVSDAVEENDLMVVSMEGTEAFNRPYEFQLDMVSTKSDLDIDKLLEEPAHLLIRQAVPSGAEMMMTTLQIHGRLAKVEQGEQSSGEDPVYHYHALLVPRLWLAGINKDSAVFQGKKIPEIIEEICEENGVDCDVSKISQAGEAREYTAQYQESDLDFINRWCEHEGYFYYFVQEDDGEKVVFADATAGYGMMPGNNKFQYKATDPDLIGVIPSSTGDSLAKEMIRTISCKASRLPKAVVLKDYNWNTPDADMVCKHDVKSNGIGIVYEYNNHYPDKPTGDNLAKVRAEMLLCREHEFHGRSECRGFRAGLVFEMEEHFRKDYNGEYVLTSVQHHARQPARSQAGAQEPSIYYNNFVAIPKAKTFRPSRVTKWPQITGVMHGVVDGGDASTPYSQLDAKGRYKIKLGFDNYGGDDGQCSKFVRKSEPYAGPDQGMHFPLLRGSEVLITHVDGDPDRPIISGAVFNESTPTVVGSSTPTLNRIATPAGTQIVMDDTQGAVQILIESKDSKTKYLMDATTDAEKITTQAGPGDAPTSFAILDAKSGEERITIHTKKSGAESYIRMGKANGETTQQDKKGAIADTDGMRLHTTGQFNQHVTGASNIYIGGEKNEWVVGKSNTTVTDHSYEYKIGDWFSFKAAASVSIGIAASFEAKLAASCSITGGIDISVKAAACFSMDLGPRVSYAKGHKWEIGEDKYNQTVKKAFTVEGLDTYTMKSGKDFMVTSATALVLEGGTGAVGALNTAIAAHATAMANWNASSGPTGTTPPPIPPAAARTTPTQSPSIKIEGTGITLKVGSSEVKITTSGITMKAGAGELKVEASGVTGTPQVKEG